MRYTSERNLITLIKSGVSANGEYANVTTDASQGSLRQVLISESIAGETVTYSITVNPTSGKEIRARLNFYNTDETRIGIVQGTDSAQNEEKRLSVTATIPEGTVRIIPSIDTNRTASTVTYTTEEPVKEPSLYIGSESTEFKLAPENSILAGDAISSDSIEN